MTEQDYDCHTSTSLQKEEQEMLQNVDIIACKEKLRWYDMEIAKELGRSQNLIIRLERAKSETKMWAIVTGIVLALVIPMIYLTETLGGYFEAFSTVVVPVYCAVIVVPSFIVFCKKLSVSLGHSTSPGNMELKRRQGKLSLSSEREDCIMKLNILRVQRQMKQTEYDERLEQAKKASESLDNNTINS